MIRLQPDTVPGDLLPWGRQADFGCHPRLSAAMGDRPFGFLHRLPSANAIGRFRIPFLAT